MRGASRGLVFIFVVRARGDLDVHRELALAGGLVVHRELEGGVVEIGDFLKEVVTGAGMVQSQADHHLAHQPRGTQHVDFVLEGEVGVVHAHVVEDGIHVARRVADIVAVVAHKDGAGSGISLGLGFVEDRGDGEAEHHGNYKPVPVVDHHEDKVANREGVFIPVLAFGACGALNLIPV